ncbi:hypothetical protein ACFL2M_01390 [Patescibacteria group bacterium]
MPRPYQPTKEELERYELPEEQDLEILGKIHELESEELSDADKQLVIFLRTQLEEDWRTPLLEFIDAMHKKYR